MRLPLSIVVLLCACSIDERVPSVADGPLGSSGSSGSSASDGNVSMGASTEQGADFPRSGALLPGSVLVAEVDAIDFGNCVRGQTFTRPLGVRNAGDTPASGLGVTIDSAKGPAFEILAGSCTDTLAPGAECVVNVTFTTDALGRRSATAVLSASGVNELRVALSGTGVAGGSLTPEQTEVDFETREVGVESETHVWAVTNTGSAATGTITLTNGDPMTFATTTDCGPPLQPGASCIVSARFVGQFRGTKTTSVTVTDGTNTAQTQLSVIAAPSLTVLINGSGSVEIPSEPSVDCESGCRVVVKDYFTLIATLRNGSNTYFAGWTSSNTERPACTGVGRECSSFIYGINETITANFAEMENNLIFVSSEGFAANLGGTTPYDAACNRLATAAGINNAAGTGYIAAISGTELFFDRVPPNARGWIRLDGMPVADTLEMLRDTTTAGLFYPVLLDELGEATNARVMTGTSETGLAGSNCDNWTLTLPARGTVTGASTTSVTWGDQSGLCEDSPRLFCMGVTKSTPVVPQTFAGKRMWPTATPFTVGAETPDAFCQASRPPGVANAAAFIAYGDGTGPDRLDPAATYVRPDGLLVGTGEEIRRVTGTTRTALRVTNDGSVLTRLDEVWTGNPFVFAPITPTPCGADWNDPTVMGVFGSPTETNQRAFSSGAGNCSEPRRLYCFEL